jgi:hypothetical protein
MITRLPCLEPVTRNGLLGARSSNPSPSITAYAEPPCPAIRLMNSRRVGIGLVMATKFTTEAQRHGEGDQGTAGKCA